MRFRKIFEVRKKKTPQHVRAECLEKTAKWSVYFIQFETRYPQRRSQRDFHIYN